MEIIITLQVYAVIITGCIVLEGSYYTLSPVANESSSEVWHAFFSGYAYSDLVDNNFSVTCPVLYLTSDITLTGDGTSSSPYTIVHNKI